MNYCKTASILVCCLIGWPLVISAQEKESTEQKTEAHGDASEQKEGPPSDVGPDKAVTAASKEEGIKLSDVAEKNIEIKTQAIAAAGRALSLPSSVLVYSQADVGIYRLRNGWFKFVSVKVLKKSSSSVTLESSEIKEGDSVVTSGADLLKLAELNVWSGGEGGE